ncbi:mTERF domain-containing protein 1, mitochondrial [Symbiodinium microadriaticum]|uniref:mTERF domain-containing protein 1, mitochondrial n=1 Tax=Symbiodinium microadriaticum TaxID=2951 RepID=A0A1Q9CVI8_SYMMI|nr:mTERF domain-containing protein 1, mitochondrial [Symbiodinium microadriaticum]
MKTAAVLISQKPSLHLTCSPSLHLPPRSDCFTALGAAMAAALPGTGPGRRTAKDLHAALFALKRAASWEVPKLGGPAKQPRGLHRRPGRLRCRGQVGGNGSGMAAIRSRFLGVLPAGLRFFVGPRLLCSAPPFWWKKGRPRTTHRSFAEVELLSRLAELLMPREPIGELFRDFPVEPSDAWGSRWLCPDITAFGVLKQKDAALFVEYDGCHWHCNAQGKQRDERKTEALLAYAPGGSVVLRIGHVTQSLRRKQTSTAMEAMVDVWRAGHVPSLMTSLHQATQSLLMSLDDALENEVRERLKSQCAKPQPGFDKSRTFVSQAVLTSDVETKKATMIAFLEQKMKISKKGIQALASKCPRIWGISIEGKLKPLVVWLQDVGLSRPQVAKVVAGFPAVLGYSIEGNLKPTVAWLEDVGLSQQHVAKDVGLNCQQVAKVVAGFPQVLGCSIDGNLKPTVAWLADVGLTQKQVAKVVACHPQVLGCSIEANLKPTVGWLEDAGLSRKQVAKVVAGFPPVLGYSIDGNLKPTVAWLANVGLSREQVAKVVAGFPAVLGCSIDKNLSRKVSLLQQCFSNEDICSMIVYLPQMLGLSYARLFRRLQVLQEHDCLQKLSRVMALTDAKFARRFSICMAGTSRNIS